MTTQTLPGFTADVPTDKASRYLQQLCKHWTHKLTVDFNENQGTVTFPVATLVLNASPDTLKLSLTPTAGEDIAPLKEVVEKHLDRFAFREGELVYNWQEINAG